LANTTGDRNTVVGDTAFQTNTTGSYNVAIGDNALQANTTASNNTAVGYQALYSNTTAADITAVGWQAGYSATGTGSTYLGSYSGNSTTGIYNTFVGHISGYLVTSGTKNTIIGRYTGNQGGLDIRTASNYIVLSDGDGNPRGIFDGSGNLLVGLTAQMADAVLNVRSSGVATAAFDRQTNDGSLLLCRRNNTTVGSINVTTSATTYATSSDYRLKDNIAPMTSALAKVSALKPVTYTWKESGIDSQGFIAHELQEVVPECVTGEKDAVDSEGKPVYQGIDTSFLVATLTAAIQEQQAIINDLKTRIETLETK
jgi:hypothetical protein